MSNPQMPGVGVMTDTLEFVKNLWGSMSVPGMGLPGMVVPTMSVQDLDKKISDLKAVEAWLNLNVSMLHGSIQALEVQRATISTLQSMGSAMAAALKHPDDRNAASLLESVPYASAFFAGTQAAQNKEAGPQAATQSATQSATSAAAQAPTADSAAAKPAAWSGDFAAQAGNPTLWWNILQDQFKQAVGTAIGGDSKAKPATAAGTKSGSAPGAATAANKAAAPAEPAAKPAASSGKPARPKAVAAKPKEGLKTGGAAPAPKSKDKT